MIMDYNKELQLNQTKTILKGLQLKSSRRTMMGWEENKTIMHVGQD